MRCSKCGHNNRTGAKFCEECGRSVARTCTSCGVQISPTAKFCPECGHPTNTEARQPRFISPKTYTPRHLAEKILTSKTALEGERKQITVLFADLKDSMELLAGRDPEEARKLLDPVVERMMEAVHHFEGTVNQVMGDGIMALFGAPLAHEDHAVRACYAALRMQDAVRRYSDELRRARGVEVQIRVGVNSGNVVVRSIGSDLRMDYTAVGQTTHLAARMEQLAVPGTIRLTEDTLRLTEAFVQVTPLGPVPIKGLGEPVEVFELVGSGAARTRLEAAARQGLTHFVGRSVEMEQLRDAIDRASLGRGQVVAVVGEPGVGKSRLVYEFTHLHGLQGWLVLESASVSYGKAMSFLPVIDLLKRYFKIEDRDEIREIREKVMRKQLMLDEPSKPSLTPLLTMLDVPVDDPPWNALDPLQRRQQTLDAVRQLLLREARKQPLLLIFEDLHWIDDETQTLLDNLVESLPAAPLLLLVTYRPEYRHAWGSKTYYRQMRIDPLPAESADELLGALLGTDEDIGPLKQILIEWTEANPLFLEESVRALEETGTLAGERGAYRLTRPVGQLELPATVQAILASRIDRLEPEDKQLLQIASVLGQDVPFAPLSVISDLSEPDLRRGLARLRAAEFLYEVKFFPEAEYTFKHALTHEVAYGGLLHDRRRRLHARVAEALEILYPNRLAEHTERLALHAFRGEVWEKAAEYARRAGDRAVERGGAREAARYAEQGLDALAHVPSSGSTLELSLHLRHLVYHRYFTLGGREQMVDWATESVTIAEKLGNKPWVARAKNILVNALWSIGENAQALALAEEVQHLAEAIGDTKTRVTIALDVGQICLSMGDYRRGADACAEGTKLLGGDLARDRLDRTAYPFVSLRQNLASCLAELGEFETAIIAAREAMSFTESIQQPVTTVIALSGLAATLLIRGEFSAAIPYLERAANICKSDYTSVYPYAAARLGLAYVMQTRHSEASVLLDEALALEGGVSSTRNEVRVMLTVIEGYMLGGRRKEALNIAPRALEYARNRYERGSEARALWLLAELASTFEIPDVKMAEENYGKALRVAHEISMRPVIAHCHHGLGRLDHRLGRSEKAREHLTAAMAMYREMGMQYWLQKMDVAAS